MMEKAEFVWRWFVRIAVVNFSSLLSFSMGYDIIMYSNSCVCWCAKIVEIKSALPLENISSSQIYETF